MPAPYEVVAAPLTVYLAPPGTEFPAIDDEEDEFDSAWEKLGTQGARNLTDGGVEVEHSEETEDFVPAGSTVAIKRFRTGEAFVITLELADVSPEVYAKVMNNAEVEQVAAGPTEAGQSSFSLYRGDQVAQFAFLGRGPSSVADGLYFHYEFSRAHVSVNGSLTWNKGTPVALPIEIAGVLYDPEDVIRAVIGEAPAQT